uniref:Uncharacterized protein n=1 Tax=Salvator merianae TaxID=96440 RepID=A0A8D0B100_SALMN
MATDPTRTPNGIMLFIPLNGDNIIQQGEVNLENVKCFVQYGNQQPGNPTDSPQENPQKGSLAKYMKKEGKTLGAIQIMIGLIHLGFGVLPAILGGSYIPLAFLKNYPIVGGLLFIASGSVSVSAAKKLNTCLERCSVGMNITSAIASLSGIVLYAVELAVNQSISQIYLTSSEYPYRTGSIGTGLCATLLIFTSMEFIITVMVAHYGCRANCCTRDPAITYVPFSVMSNKITNAEDSRRPPAYNETTE